MRALVVHHDAAKGNKMAKSLGCRCVTSEEEAINLLNLTTEKPDVIVLTPGETNPGIIERLSRLAPTLVVTYPVDPPYEVMGVGVGVGAFVEGTDLPAPKLKAACQEAIDNMNKRKEPPPPPEEEE